MRFHLIVIAILLACLAKPIYGQNDSINNLYAAIDTLNEDARLFIQEDLLRISLRFDITEYKKNKSDKEYLDALLTWYTNENDTINTELKLRSRGKFRRDFCDFPPLMLNFKIKDTQTGEFKNVNKLKMVTHCFHGNEENLLKEYLIYKLYNIITENSFRVRLLRVTYLNTATKKQKPVNEYAFVIEPEELLAARINAVDIPTVNLTQKKVKPEIMDRLAIFNYMIGNTDWSVPIRHNILLLAQPNSSNPELGAAIPYDFDFSGLVGSHYATPFEGLNIKSIKQRLYLGMCRSEEVFANALIEYSEKKEQLFAVISEFPYLGEKPKKEMISYLNGFFKGIDERNSNVKGMMNSCIRIGSF